MITLVCLLMFVITLKVKWLFGVLPLWGFPIAALFAFIHFLATPLWRYTGRLPRQPLAPRNESPTVA
ncbi:MAG: hypothetical protein QOH21_1624 [Acidobacteriota bacterium]|nr:hypothetical protein [Acidobacteriota bacterium]